LGTDWTRHRMRAFHGGALLSCLACLALAPFARAQTASPEDIASARALGTEGFRLADAGDCASAVPKLEAAEKLYHAPTTLGRLGECQVKLGQVVAGAESLNRVVRETLPPNAPAAFVSAQHHAAQLLATAQQRIGKLRIHVEGASIDTVAVTVDGANVPSALFDDERPTDPGAHEVKAVAPGHKTVTAKVQLPEGGDSTVSLKLEPDATPSVPAPESGPVAAPAAAPPLSPSAAPPPAPHAPNPVPAFIALGIGGVGVAVGSVFGILALSTKSSLDSACMSKSCPASSQSDIDALSTRATVSNIGFAVGVVGVATGAVLLITSQSGDARPANARRVRMRPWLGLGTAGLGGTFE
jgi:hypothetical protein